MGSTVPRQGLPDLASDNYTFLSALSLVGPHTVYLYGIVSVTDHTAVLRLTGKEYLSNGNGARSVLCGFAFMLQIRSNLLFVRLNFFSFDMRLTLIVGSETIMH